MIELLSNLRPVTITDDPVRKNIINLWNGYITSYDIGEYNHSNDGLEIYFKNYPYMPEARDIVVIASLLAWLPSNAGISFLHECNQLTAKHNSRELGYTFAWAKENKRLHYMSNGYTTLEYLLTPIEYYDVHRGLICAPNRFITIYDIEAANYFINWLASADGQYFLKIVDAQHKILY